MCWVVVDRTHREDNRERPGDRASHFDYPWRINFGNLVVIC
jgi:hypothetical protein